MSETGTLTPTRTPTVYFIDDSATMREVIKIAFRKESIHVITCPDAASALAQFGEAAPDAVITDVIMPGKDGYEVCQLIKQSEHFARIPVILMSGVVNRAVAEKATAVKADELIRKPFQPRDLIARVKSLLHPKFPGLSVEESSTDEGAHRPSQVLSGLFSPSATPVAPSSFAAPRADPAPLASATARPAAPAASAPPMRPAAPIAGPTAAEVQKLRNEIARLEFLVKKLQAELEAERQYCAALETHLKNPPGSE
jgi:CheY-like chemotaxis protein